MGAMRRQNRDLRNLLDSCSCLYFMDVIIVGNANAQEVVLHVAIKVLMSFNSAEEHCSYSGFSKAYLFAMYIGS